MADVNYKIKASDDFSPALDKLIKKLDGLASSLTKYGAQAAKLGSAQIRSSKHAQDALLKEKKMVVDLSNRNNIELTKRQNAQARYLANTEKLKAKINTDSARLELAREKQLQAKKSAETKDATARWSVHQKEFAKRQEAIAKKEIHQEKLAAKISRDRAEIKIKNLKAENQGFTEQSRAKKIILDTESKQYALDQKRKVGIIGTSRVVNSRGKLVRETIRSRDSSGNVSSVTHQGEGSGGGGTYLGKLTRGLGLGYLAFRAKDYAVNLAETQAQVRGAESGLGAIFENKSAKALPSEYRGLSSNEMARRELGRLKETSRELGMGYQENMMPYMQLMGASNMPVEATRKTFTAFSGYGKLMGLNSEAMTGTFRALQQMQNKTTVKSEELVHQLGDRAPNALRLFADAAKVSVPVFVQQMQDGQVSANIMALVADEIQRKFGERIKENSKNIGAEMGRTRTEIDLLNQSLAAKLEPTINSFLRSVQGAAQGTSTFFNAFGDISAFNKLGKEAQAAVTALDLTGSAVKRLYNDYKVLSDSANFDFGWLFPLTAAIKAGMMPVDEYNRVQDAKARIAYNAPMPNSRLASTPQMSTDPRTSNGKVEVEVTVAGIPMGSEVKTKTSGGNISSVKTNSSMGSSRTPGGGAAAY